MSESLRVLYVIHSFPRLYHTFLLNDMVRLRKKGIEIFILSIRKPDEEVVNKDAETFLSNTFYLDHYNHRIHRFPLRQIIRLLNKTKNRLPRFYDLMCGLIFRSYNDKKHLKKYFRDFGWRTFAFRDFVNNIKKYDINRIHAGFANTSASAALILSEMTGTPFTFEAHANDIYVNFPHAEEKLKKAKKIITISDYNKKYLVSDYGCEPQKVIIKRVPFNKDYCDLLSGTKREENSIVSVGRLDPIKGLPYAIEAFSRVSQSYPDLMYYIVGDGVLKGSLIAQVTNLNLTKKIIFLGSMENTKALEIIARSTIFLLPSVISPDGDRDGIPTALIEAMYLRTPVIGSRLSGIPELIDNDVNGYLVEPGSIEDISGKLKLLIENPKLRETFGYKGRLKVESEFDIDVNNDKLIAAWQDK